MRVRKHGTTELLNRNGKNKHPNIQAWRDRQPQLLPEWKYDFWKFVEDVGTRPSKNHYLRKIYKDQPYSKDNFEWIEHIKRIPSESDKDWCKRKWQQRLKLNPSLKQCSKLFQELYKSTGLSLLEYSQIYLQKSSIQNNLCAICLTPEQGVDPRTKNKIRLSLDHCHSTKKIRDLLCRACNQALGLWEEKSEWLHHSIKYLEKYRTNPTGIQYGFKTKAVYLHSKIIELDNKCEICNNLETRICSYGKVQKLSVDHCHQTNMIRGLLCARCNTAIGKVRDSIEIIISMISYIEKHK